MYYITIFNILSDIKFGDVFYQEIDKKFLKRLENEEESEAYIADIKNMNLMRHFPYAVIEKIDNSAKRKITEQKIFKFNKSKSQYIRMTSCSEIATSTRTMINPLEDDEYVFVNNG